MVVVTKNSKIKKVPAAFNEAVSNEAFLLIAIASFTIGFVASLMIWLFTVDYIFVVLK